MPVSNTPKPGATRTAAQNMVGDALYAWCCKEQDFGYVFTQDEFQDSNIIPNRDLNILLSATGYLINKHLLKLHDIKGQEGIGWELVSPDIAQSYDGLTTDEQMVYASIESSGAQGIWTKTIKAKSGVHAKVLERTYKNLESKQLIKQMKSVKNPGRKMYILYGLQPSEEATGGAWFTEGKLDVDMIAAISQLIEMHCSNKSWKEVTDDDDSDMEFSHSRKRKQPSDNVDAGKGSSKVRKNNDDEKEAVNKSKPEPVFEPYEPNYTGYPTIRDVSKAVIASRVIESGQVLPDNALHQLLDVMVYDDRLYKVYRNCRAGEIPDDLEKNQVVMYRCFKTPFIIFREQRLQGKIKEGRMSAIRAQELEDIGRGGSSEVPCLGCPNFDICGNGGQINAETCVYFDKWFARIEEAEREEARKAAKEAARETIRETDNQRPSSKARPDKSGSPQLQR